MTALAGVELEIAVTRSVSIATLCACLSFGTADVALSSDGGIGVGDDDSTGSIGTTPDHSGTGGGASGRPKTKTGRRAPLLRKFQVSPSSTGDGQGAKISYRIDDRDRRVRVSLRLVESASAKVLVKKRLGSRRTGIQQRYTLTGLSLAPGSYRVVLSARDRDGHKLKTRKVARAANLTISDHYFPIDGQWSWSGPGGEFGAGRRDHIHQGYDIIASEGQRVVTPTSGTVSWVDYQATGAGHYIVVDGSDGYAYVFMHLRAGSVQVKKADRVQPKQLLGEVGSTGASLGPHLHFEIWQNGWFSGTPIDPKPLLRSWADAVSTHALPPAPSTPPPASSDGGLEQ